MNDASGLKRQLVRTMAFIAAGISLFWILGSFAVYGLLDAYSPESISEDIIPSGAETAWISLSFVIAFAAAIFVAVKLANRILRPLNSVATSLRLMANGDLSVRANSDEHSLSEFRLLLNDFNLMAERLENTEKERAYWNAAIAHELRTPVTILRGRIQGLTEGVFEPSQAIFTGLLSQVEGLNRIIEDLRVLSLNENGRLQLQLDRANLSEQINSVCRSYQLTFTQAGFQLEVDCSDVLVTCDPSRIKQALLALLENALKYAQPGAIKVTGRLVDGVCFVEVEDTGPGISIDEAVHIFDMFHRGDPSRARSTGGSGLGLSVVQTIMKAHDGQASYKPSDRGGSIFRLQWPT